MQVDMQDKFFAWLAVRVSSAQLSEFYTACKDLEIYCMNKHILIAPLFETTNTVIIQDVLDVIKSNRKFQFKYFYQLGMMRKAMDYYMTFLKEVSLNQSGDAEMFLNSNEKFDTYSEKCNTSQNVVSAGRTSELETIEVKVGNLMDEKPIVSTENNMNSREDIVAENVLVSVDKNSKVSIWNFSDDNIDFSNISPIAIVYFGDEKEAQGWENAFRSIICAMQEDYPSIIRGMVGYRFSGVGKVVLSGTAGMNKFRRPVEINNRLYLETDCEPYEIITIVRVLMSKCNMDYHNIAISYKITDAGVIQGDEALAVPENAIGGEGTQDYIVQVLNELNIPYVDFRNHNGYLWIIGDDKISFVFNRFIQYDAVFYYKEDGSYETQGKSAWWTKDIIIISKRSFEHESGIEESVESSITEIGSEDRVAPVFERKAEFENWLVNSAGIALRLAKIYSSAINVAGQYSVKWGFSEKELFYILNTEQVYQISRKLLAKSEFAYLNNSQHNRYHTALLQYLNYCKAVSSNVTINTPIASISKQGEIIKKNRIAFIAWAQSQKMSKATILAYLLDIKKCSEFAQEQNYVKEKHLFLIEDSNILEHVLWNIRTGCKFAELGSERQKRLVSAMNKLIDFCRVTEKDSGETSSVFIPAEPIEKVVQKSCVSESISSANRKIIERYNYILAEKFEDGFRPSKAIDKNRFRMYYSDMFGDELTEDDEHFVRTLLKIGTLRDERIFVKDETEQKDLLEEINDTITETFKDGASCIYLECLFTRFQEQLAEMLHIYTVDSLERVLFSSGRNNYFKRYNYLSGYDKEPSPNRDVIEYMKRSHLPITYSEIEKDLWYIPLDKIKHELVITSAIVNVASEAYLYAPNLPVSENEVQQIEELIRHALLQRNYISDVELMQLIEIHCPSVLMNTPDYSVWGLRNALAYLLHDKFSFRGAIISEKDEEISMAEVFSDFCQRSEHITVDELKQFASELNTIIYWDSVYSEMVRINQNEFVRREQIYFDVEQIDSVLDNLIQGDYTPIKTINLFLHFPTIDVPWNNFVLESYVAHYSQKFILLHTSYSATDCCGAVLRKDSGISDYRTLIVDVLVKNTGWKNKKDALQLLVDLGYQQRRSYSDIEKVMQEAKAKLQTQKN